MTETAPDEVMLHDPAETLDPLADADDAVVKNRAKVGLSASVVAAVHLRARRDHGPAGILGDAGWAR